MSETSPPGIVERDGCSGVAKDPEVAAASHLDGLGVRLKVRLEVRPGAGRKGDRTLSGSARLPDGIREGEQVVGRRRRRDVVTAEPHDLPAPWHGQPLGVLGAEVVGVRLGIRRERPEDDGGVAVDVGQGGDGGTGAPGL